MIYSPSIVTNLSELMAAIDFYGIEKRYYGSQWLPLTVWLPTFFKISMEEIMKLKKVMSKFGTT